MELRIPSPEQDYLMIPLPILRRVPEYRQHPHRQFGEPRWKIENVSWKSNLL